MLLSSHILIMPALNGTLTSMKNQKRKYKSHKQVYPVLRKIGQQILYIQQRVCVYKRVHQCINAITFKFVSNSYHHYLNQICEYAPQCSIESRRNISLIYLEPRIYRIIIGIYLYFLPI